MAAAGLLLNRISLKNNKSVINPLVTNYLFPRETKLQNSKKAKIHGIRQVAQCDANNPDKLSDKAENVPNQSNNVSNQLPNQLKAMLALISRNPQITYNQLAKELNISRETVRRHIGKLRDDYKIISRSGSTRGYWIVLEK